MQTKENALEARCPECGQGRLVRLTRDEEFKFELGDGETVKVLAEMVPINKCDKCGEEMSGPEAAKIRHDAICRAAGLLPPGEIKALREKLGWSQQLLAKLSGLGLATISRWERGQLLQNRSNNMILQAIRDCLPFREYLENRHAKVQANGPASGPGTRSASRITKYLDDSGTNAAVAKSSRWQLRPVLN